MKKIILVDISYTSFYRFFAAIRWFSFNQKELWEKLKDDGSYDWSKNEDFMKMYSNMYVKSMMSLVGRDTFVNSTVCFCQDAKQETLWRMEIKDDYKGNRPDQAKKTNYHGVFKYTYETLIPEILEEFPNIIQFQFPKTEADDIIAVITKSLCKSDNEIIIISADDDFTQLCCDNVQITDYRTKEFKCISKEEAHERLTKKIINGDKSDNITPVFDKKKVKPKLKKELIESPKKLKEYLDSHPEEKQKYKLNRRLINFDYIPTKIKDVIIDNIYVKLKKFF